MAFIIDRTSIEQGGFMDSISLNAYAKINLALDVIGQRENGYHDVRMIMQTIRLYDKISIRKTIRSTITLNTNLPYLPVNENNLVYAAADSFLKTLGIKEGVFIQLEKRIPVSAGLAGGSTDAAATLYGLNELFNTKLSLTQLQELGVLLGADIPFCLLRGTALSEGIGEILTPLVSAPSCWCLLVKPPVNVSTRYVYEHLSLSCAIHPDIDAMCSAIQEKNLQKLAGRLGNILESVTQKEYPEILEIKKQMLSFGALGALMSGSGPTVFGLFDDKKAAQKAFYSFKIGEYGKQTFLTRFYQPYTT